MYDSEWDVKAAASVAQPQAAVHLHAAANEARGHAPRPVRAHRGLA